MRGEERNAGFTAYVAARQAHLRAVGYALCGDWHRADDLVQTALTRLYVAWPRLVREGAEDAYVRQILVRAHIDEHRRSRRRPERVGLTLIDDRAVADPDVVERDAIVAALQTLPPRQRACFVLRHWLDLSVAETARELGIGEGTVKSHTSRAVAALAALLAEDDCTASTHRETT